MPTCRTQIIGLYLVLSVAGCVPYSGDPAPGVPNKSTSPTVFGISAPRIDATSDETAWLSIQTIRDSLSPERKEQFNQDIQVLAKTKPPGTSLAETMRPFHGMIVTELHDRAEEERRR